MMVGIEFLIIAILVILFSNGGIAATIYSILSVVVSLTYYLLYLKEYKMLDDIKKNELKSQVSYKLIIIAIMITTINLVYNVSQ